MIQGLKLQNICLFIKSIDPLVEYRTKVLLLKVLLLLNFSLQIGLYGLELLDLCPINLGGRVKDIFYFQ